MQGSWGNSFPSQHLLGNLRRSMMPQDLQNTRNQLSQKKVKAKHRLRETPVRMTSSIFPRPVTRITSHPKNIIKYRKSLEENLEKPMQLCAFNRLQEYLVEDSKGRIQAEAKVPSGVNNLQTFPPPSSEKMVQVQLSPSSFSQGVTLPVVIPPLPSLSSQVVTTTDIRRHAQKVDIARERLAALLEADKLARQAENMAEQ